MIVSSTNQQRKKLEERSEEDGEKIGRELSEVSNRAVSRGQNELIGEFKMAAGDVICIRGRL